MKSLFKVICICILLCNFVLTIEADGSTCPTHGDTYMWYCDSCGIWICSACFPCHSCNPPNSERSHVYGPWSGWTSINDSQHARTKTCTNGDCGASKTEKENHTKAWVGLTYKCTEGCGWVNTTESGKAAEAHGTAVEAQANASSSSGASGSSQTQSGICEIESKAGDTDVEYARTEEGYGDGNAQAAAYQETVAVAAKGDVDELNLEIDILTALKQEKLEEDNKEKICSICGAVLLAGNPVNVLNGSKIESFTDLTIGSINVAPRIDRQYNNQNEIALSWGQGWELNYDSRIIFGVKPKAQEAYILAVLKLAEVRKAYIDAETAIGNALVHYRKSISFFRSAADNYGEAKDAKDLAYDHIYITP
ncbi:MAG: hypothetical protein KAU17_16095, partial [Spirochaetales bacterium]|nr:hypothetical protein [Spirochaetales bacterium]